MENNKVVFKEVIISKGRDKRLFKLQVGTKIVVKDVFISVHLEKCNSMHNKQVTLFQCNIILLNPLLGDLLIVKSICTLRKRRKSKSRIVPRTFQLN